MLDLTEDFATIQAKVDELQSVADAVVQPIKPMIAYIKLDDKKYRYSAYRDKSWGCFNLMDEYFYWSGRGYGGDKVVTREQIDKVLSVFDGVVEEWKADNLETYNTNQESMKHNKAQVAKIEAIMKVVGIRRNYSTWEYKRSTSKKRTETKHTAGYVSDVKRLIPTECAFEGMLKELEAKRKRVEKFGVDNLEAYAKKQEEKDADEARQAEVHKLALLRAKYTPDNANSSFEEIRESLNSKNKYVALAYWLERNRCDWSDGYTYAEDGLSQFEVETPEDALVKGCIEDCLDYDDIDGRVFRDCEYNYNVLYSMADDEQLVADSNELYLLEI